MFMPLDLISGYYQIPVAEKDQLLCIYPTLPIAFLYSVRPL